MLGSNVYRYDTSTKELTLVTTALVRPNGIALFDDRKNGNGCSLFLSDTGFETAPFECKDIQSPRGLDGHGDSTLYMMTDKGDGCFSAKDGPFPRQPLTPTTKGIQDGMEVHQLAELLFFCDGNGLWVWSIPMQKQIGLVAFPDGCTQVMFSQKLGVNNVFILKEKELYEIPLNFYNANNAAERTVDACIPPPMQHHSPIMTKPSDRAALLSLWEAMGRPGVMIDWGNEDPCIGTATTPNASGFAFWKGVACQPCNEDPTLYCVRSIFLHQKNLKGSIPSTFSNLSDLEILMLSANNITGTIEKGILSSFPKLRRLYLSYNMINGTLPLSDLSGLHDLKEASFDNNHLDAIDNPPPPFTGGFENLKSLNFNYNRNMTCNFPSAIAFMPKLDHVNIHDTVRQ